MITLFNFKHTCAWDSRDDKIVGSGGLCLWCRDHTTWLDICFETYICSEECERAVCDDMARCAREADEAMAEADLIAAAEDSERLWGAVANGDPVQRDDGSPALQPQDT